MAEFFRTFRLARLCGALILLLFGLARGVIAHHPGTDRAMGASGGTEAVSGHSSPWDKDYVAPGKSLISPEMGQSSNQFAQVLEIGRDEQGRFHTDGEINGRSTTMLIDTGADVVAIPASEASSLGIMVEPDQFRPILRTASGSGMAAEVTIDSLSLGGTTLRRVAAVVVQDLDRVLLGQSALRRFGRVEITGDRMVLHPA